MYDVKHRDALPLLEYVGHEPAFTASHRAARYGIHRRYGPHSVAHLEPFGSNASTDDGGWSSANIAFHDVNWPEELWPSVAA